MKQCSGQALIEWLIVCLALTVVVMVLSQFWQLDSLIYQWFQNMAEHYRYIFNHLGMMQGIPS